MKRLGGEVAIWLQIGDFVVYLYQNSSRRRRWLAVEDICNSSDSSWLTHLKFCVFKKILSLLIPSTLHRVTTPNGNALLTSWSVRRTFFVKKKIFLKWRHFDHDSIVNERHSFFHNQTFIIFILFCGINITSFF